MKFSSRDARLARLSALCSGGQATDQQRQARCAKTYRLLSTFCSCNRTSEFASRKRVHRTCGDCTLIESDTGFTTVCAEIGSKSYRCGIQVGAPILLFNGMSRTMPFDRTPGSAWRRYAVRRRSRQAFEGGVITGGRASDKMFRWEHTASYFGVSLKAARTPISTSQICAHSCCTWALRSAREAATTSSGGPMSRSDQPPKAREKGQALSGSPSPCCYPTLRARRGYRCIGTK